jgi:hypothetical protein
MSLIIQLGGVFPCGFEGGFSEEKFLHNKNKINY